MYTSYILGNRVNFLRFPVILLKKTGVLVIRDQYYITDAGGHGYGQANRIGRLPVFTVDGPTAAALMGESY